MFQEMLSRCAANLGEPPRRFSLWDRLTYWRVPRPDWLDRSPDDGLENLFSNLPRLRREGKVVRGYHVQANYLLYEPGKFDCPAEVVYCLGDSDPIRTVALPLPSRYWPDSLVEWWCGPH